MSAAPPEGWTQLSITRWLPGVALRPNGVSGATSVAVGVADCEPEAALAPTRLTARTRNV